MNKISNEGEGLPLGRTLLRPTPSNGDSAPVSPPLTLPALLLSLLQPAADFPS